MLIFGAVIFSSAPFWHINFSRNTQEIIHDQSIVDGLRDSRNEKRSLLINELMTYAKSNPDSELGKIGSEYIEKKNEVVQKNKKLSVLKEEQKVLGFNNMRDFMYNIGLFIFILFLSLIIIFASILLKKIDKPISLALFGCGFISLLVSLYFINWAFFIQVDYNVNRYHWMIITVSFIISISSFLYYVYKKTILEKLKSTVNFILDVRNDHFQKVAIRAMEVDEEETINDIIEFEDKTKEELSKLVGR
ncbi:hypothetical protein AWE51_00045 [Aquimarina aggregata]|uniref:Uncharacterized protein n=1 Tax=Aquimarina aggregata TaxID=1642818 RepID=A0A163BXD9_9FLAO|nr:hypothetical protein AWE51_00045 [Aquimarina aggregata]